MHHDNYSESGKQLSDMESILKGMGFAEPVEEGKMSKEKHKKEARRVSVGKTLMVMVSGTNQAKTLKKASAMTRP